MHFRINGFDQDTGIHNAPNILQRVPVFIVARDTKEIGRIIDFEI